jgi:hypothetical protein
MPSWTAITIFGGFFYAAYEISDLYIAQNFRPKGSKPGTPEDEAQMQALDEFGKLLPTINAMTSAGWVEHEAYGSITEEERKHRLTTGPMRGAYRIGSQKVFTKDGNGVVVFVRLGDELAGFPTVVHGGVMATILDETMGRAAIAGLEGHTGEPSRRGVCRITVLIPY